MTTTFEHLLHLSRASANVLHIASYEWERVRGNVIGLAKDLCLPMRAASDSNRRFGRRTGGPQGDEFTTNFRGTL